MNLCNANDATRQPILTQPTRRKRDCLRPEVPLLDGVKSVGAIRKPATGKIIHGKSGK
jgi:hypothetical protein